MKQYKVVIQYYSGVRKGHIITIEGIEDEDIMGILGEITQEQLAHADITVSDDHSHLNY